MTRLRRAPLFVPGDSHRKIEKSLTLNADSLILELEDGVAYSQKIIARETVTQALKTLDFGHSERLVRINPPGSGLAEADLTETLAGQPDGYVIPKVETAQDLLWVDQTITAYEQQHNWPHGEIKLLALIETALGVMNLREIATATPRLEALMFGAEDLAGSMGATRTPAGWEGFYAKSAVVTAAAAFGLQAIDTPHVALNDPAGLITAAQQALEMGYSGKMAIHPAQLEPIQHVFTPTPEAVAAAQRLLEAYQHHLEQGQGAFVFNDHMIDKPMIRVAEKLLQKVSQINAQAD